ncbi:MAG: cytochrome c family protein [Thermodesulfobacteriota bacterium]
MNGSKMPGTGAGRWKKILRAAAALLVAAPMVLLLHPAWAQDEAADQQELAPVVGGGYVGSKKCAECHKNQYDKFVQYSRKSKSFDAIRRMKRLSPSETKQCYACHTTGYGVQTGFVSYEKTPYLADVGCEACHGPGKLHTETMDMAHIVKTVTIDVCEKCHDSKKVTSFLYKKVIYAGAH